MRDIRDDLRQRLVRIGLQRAELQARFEWLGQVEGHIKAAIEYETSQAENDQSMLFSEPSVSDHSPLGQFVREALSDLKPRSLDELKNLAASRGLDFREKNPGRVLHFTLVGMAQNNLVERLASGDWRLTHKAMDQRPLAVIEDATLM